MRRGLLDAEQELRARDGLEAALVAGSAILEKREMALDAVEAAVRVLEEDVSFNAGRGSVLTASFELDGQEFVALNGGPQFKFSEAISFVVNCETQAEVDEFWEKLSTGGEKGRCGWLKDRFGVSWQIVPAALGEMMLDKDPRKSENVMKAILQMDKLDLQTLRNAYMA